MTDLVKLPGYEPCEKIDPCEVNAYVSLKLDPENPTGVILDSSWGEVPVDLKSIVKAGETITRLELAPENNPTVVRYFREDGGIDCITGDDLSRIISMKLLKDVDQSTVPMDGDVYQYDGTTNLFEPFDLKTALSDINTFIGRLQQSIVNLQNQITAIDGRVTAIETKLTPPADAPSGVGVVFGNINVYGDKDYTGSNTLNKNHGLYTHTLATDMLDDLVAS